MDEIDYEYFIFCASGAASPSDSDSSPILDADDDSDHEEAVVTAEVLAAAGPSLQVEPDLEQVGQQNDELLVEITSTKDSGCCDKQCLQGLPSEDIFTHALSMLELQHDQKEMYLMGKINISAYGADRKRLSYTYYHNGKELCKTSFMLVHNIKRTQLQNIIDHLRESSPAVTARTHGNVGKKPKHALTFEDTTKCVQFMLNYADVHGLPQPAAPRGRDGHPPVYLPVSTTQTTLHSNYVESCREACSRALGLTSFVSTWKQCCPHICIATPQTDVCKTCETLRKEISDAVSETDKLDTSSRLKEHVEHAQAERQFYRNSLAKAEEEWNSFGLELPVVTAPLSLPLTDVHYTFDFAQQVTVPHHARQMGPLYFLSPRKVQVFGVAMEGQHKQYNFMFDEDQSIGQDGKLSHGPNAVLSMLDSCFSMFGLGEQRCQIHCDNCGGESSALILLSYMVEIIFGLHS